MRLCLHFVQYIIISQHVIECKVNRPDARDHPRSCMWDTKGIVCKFMGEGSGMYFILFYKVITHLCGNE